MTPAGTDRDHEDALHVHFKETGHTYHMHAGTRHQALVDALAKLGTATGPSIIKKFVTVLTLVQFLGPDTPPAVLALVFDLLPPMAVKLYGNLMRGTIAAAVAALRSSDMEKPQIEPWLDQEIKKRPTLDFNARDVVRWFTDCTSAKAPVPRDTLDMFRALRPDPLLSVAEAKEWVVSLLDSLVARKAGPLKTKPRRRR